MSIKELQEAKDENKMTCGIKQVLKAAKSKKKKDFSVFVAKDCREETIEKLEKEKVEFEVLKTKEEMAKSLGLNFESEIFMIN